jgi:hypothetical protein
MKYETAVRQRLAGIFGRYADDLNPSIVVEPQLIIRLTPRRDFESSEWKYITETAETIGGCWESTEKAWKIPRFLGRINLPTVDRRLSSDRLFIRSLTLQNLVFLHDVFRGKQYVSWQEVQAALFSLQPRGRQRRKYSKAACRDYLGALLALMTG